VTHKVVEKSGAWYTYAGERVGQGRENAKRFLQENPAMADEIEGKLRAALGLTAPAEGEAQDGPPGPAARAAGAERG
jgi:recombination protein RecA